MYFVWFAMLFADEVLQLFTLTFHDWFRNMFNKMDTIMYLLVTVGLVLVHIPTEKALEGATGREMKLEVVTSREMLWSIRNVDTLSNPVEPDEKRFYDIGRIFLSLGSIVFYIRLLHMFTVDAALGPTLLMIQKMIKDFKVSRSCNHFIAFRV